MTQYLSQGSLALLLWRAFWLGAAIGALYSVFGIRRAAFQQWRLPRLLSVILLHLEDFLLCVAGGALLSVLYFATTRGVVRWMAIPALGAGIWLWRRTLGRWIDSGTRRILAGLAWLYRLLLRRLLAPIGRLIQRYEDRRFYRRLQRKSRAVTARYKIALEFALRQGRLPAPNFNNKHSKTKERNQ